MLAAYRKTVASLVGTVLTWAALAYMPTGHVDRNGWFALALAVATSFGVFGVTNTPAPLALAPSAPSVKSVPPVAGPAPVVPVQPVAPVPAAVTVSAPLALVSVPDPTAVLPGHIVEAPTRRSDGLPVSTSIPAGSVLPWNGATS
jgi:hypothetical protein